MKLKSGMIVSTVFALWFSVYFEDHVETIISYVLILSFGVLHGANDLRLIHKVSKNVSKIPFVQSLRGYVFVVLAVFALFFAFPELALPIFILISGYHFGEQHLSKSIRNKSLATNFFYSVYGLFILFMLFYIKSEQVIIVLKEILNVELSAVLFQYLFFSSGVVLIGFGTFYYLKKYMTSNAWEEIFVLMVFFVIFKTASLLWGFCIYFIIWHSIPSLKDQMHYLYGKVSWVAFARYVKESFVYWAISLIGLAILLWLLKDNIQNVISVLIYFLAAITFPHVLVMSKLEHKD